MLNIWKDSESNINIPGKNDKAASAAKISELEKKIEQVQKELIDLKQNNDEMRKKITDNKNRTKDLEEIVCFVYLRA